MKAKPHDPDELRMSAAAFDKVMRGALGASLPKKAKPKRAKMRKATTKK